ncbi:MAG: flagellar biosynthesis anti-sigma factor FlgM [Acidobacteriota bacterium]|nr:flagellar biosynthesis anti-sigma factor FlgM [Acidobacteriota bacterium]MDQ7088976.1 flagellar biosynthesis anti-sigma factor FlgM [Acidobacteriota bacterium]
MKVSGSDPLSRLRDLLRKIDESDRAQRSDDRSSQRSPDPSEVTPSGDSVDLSARARELRSLREAVESSPESRRDLVEQLRAEIASGRYRIDGTRIVEGLLAETDELDQ